MLAHQLPNGERGHADGVDREKQEPRVGIKQLAAIGDEFGQAFFQLPNFAIGAAAIFRRIEDDAVIALAAPHFAGGELHRIIDDPADGLVGHVRQRRIGTRGLDRFLGGIHVRHSRPLGGKRQAADAGIAEQVHRGRRVHARQLPAHPGPHRRHVRKEAQMPERRWLHGEADFFPASGPALFR